MHIVIKCSILFLLALFLIVGINSISRSETIDDLVYREGQFYQKFTDIPFNGALVGMQQGMISNGKKQGAWLEFWITGQLKGKGNYQDGMKTGQWLWFFTNGQLMGRGEYRQDKEEGEWLFLLRDGTNNLLTSGTYKEGKKIDVN
ncbi:hypothetical protein N9C75_04210 [Alphaproteobacteria bacterium]|nr:hypothetical protein [Alphaproteobacteria bacterium]